MCGLAGFAGEGSVLQLGRMAASLHRRGPDDEGFFTTRNVGFAFRRLSVIDLETGHQPVANEDGTIHAMLNGEIYNFKELRSELQVGGHRFKTGSDSEVIVHAYEHWGDECFSKFDGMFAIALWDQKRDRLILGRDRFGKKPLYWTVYRGTLWFASELKALLAAGVIDRRIDPQSLRIFFRSDFVPTPRTIFRGVNKLRPASALAWSGSSIEKQWAYWSIPNFVHPEMSFEDALQGLRTRIDAAVLKRLVSDVPLGLFLSGGLDSSLIAESASRQAQKKLSAFSIGFDDATYDERESARAVAEACGLDLHEHLFTQQEAEELLQEAVQVFDEPLADPATLPQLALARFARQSVTVALSGDGGDELLLGYSHVPVHEHLIRYSYPTSLRRIAARILRGIPATHGYFSPGFKAQRLARGIAANDLLERDLAWRGAFTKEGCEELLLPGFAGDAAVDSGSLFDTAGLNIADPEMLWHEWVRYYLRSYLMDDVLVKVDRSTMRYGLEARAPLLDAEVVSWLMQVPSKWKLGPYGGKAMFRALLKGPIPEKVLRRPKHGFGVPVARWLNGWLAPLLDEFSEDAFLRNQAIFSLEAVRRLRKEHARGIDRRKELWSFLTFQLWFQKWLA